MTTIRHEATVPLGAAGRRFDQALAEMFPDYSRSRLSGWVKSGAVTLDGVVAPPRQLLRGGEQVRLQVELENEVTSTPEDIALTIVHEDEHLLVLDKPAGLVVHPAPGNPDGTLVNALIAHCGDSLSGIGGERRPGIVHRLDKDTTGLMVVAKNDRAHRALAAQFADHGKSGEPFERSYLAFVWGAPDRPQGTIDKPIDRNPNARDRMAVREGGREAITYWQVLERYQGQAEAGRGKKAPLPVAAMVACRLETGRTHQIRVHLAAIGHPLLGDETYGSGFRTKAGLLPEKTKEALAALGRQALHSHILSVKHPATGEFLTFRSELPPDLSRLRSALASKPETGDKVSVKT